MPDGSLRTYPNPRRFTLETTDPCRTPCYKRAIRMPRNTPFCLGLHLRRWESRKASGLVVRLKYEVARHPPGHSNWVELRGLEPLTPCLQSRCAASCAIAPECRTSVEHAAGRAASRLREAAPAADGTGRTRHFATQRTRRRPDAFNRTSEQTLTCGSPCWDAGVRRGRTRRRPWVGPRTDAAAS